ncbi:hypothetical protein D4R87_01135 [bacterium]|nr:MAG: hypothetical protein D4R87_01135 [bacterium]
MQITNICEKRGDNVMDENKDVSKAVPVLELTPKGERVLRGIKAIIGNTTEVHRLGSRLKEYYKEKEESASDSMIYSGIKELEVEKVLTETRRERLHGEKQKSKFYDVDRKLLFSNNIVVIRKSKITKGITRVKKTVMVNKRDPSILEDQKTAKSLITLLADAKVELGEVRAICEKKEKWREQINKDISRLTERINALETNIKQIEDGSKSLKEILKVSRSEN